MRIRIHSFGLKIFLNDCFLPLSLFVFFSFFFILLLLSLFDYIRFRILKLCSIEQLRRTSLL